MIQLPEEAKGPAAIRVLVEALAQGLPITAALAHIYRFTHPSEMERELAIWRQEISSAVNEHERLLKIVSSQLLPRSGMGSVALAIAMWLVEQSESGLQEAVAFDEVRTAFSDYDKGELEEACFELRHLGLIEIDAAMGHPVLDLSPSYNLYFAYDPIVIKTNPVADARALARKILEDDNLGSIANLDAVIGWPRRRFNPAVARLMPLIKTKGNEIQNRYPTTFFDVQSEDRFHLKKFVADEER